MSASHSDLWPPPPPTGHDTIVLQLLPRLCLLGLFPTRGFRFVIYQQLFFNGHVLIVLLRTQTHTGPTWWPSPPAPLNWVFLRMGGPNLSLMSVDIHVYRIFSQQNSDCSVCCSFTYYDYLLLVTRNLLKRQLRVPEAMLFVRDVGCRVWNVFIIEEKLRV